MTSFINNIPVVLISMYDVSVLLLQEESMMKHWHTLLFVYIAKLFHIHLEFSIANSAWYYSLASEVSNLSVNNIPSQRGDTKTPSPHNKHDIPQQNARIYFKQPLSMIHSETLSTWCVIHHAAVILSTAVK